MSDNTVTPTNVGYFALGVTKSAMKMKLPAGVIERLADLIGFLERNTPLYDTVLFRGQRRDDWPLLPKLARLSPREDRGVLETEKRMMKIFKVRAPAVLDRDPETAWEWLAVAQHHGMATRLLDWTSNPLVALWFAIEKPAEKDRDGILWVFTPADEDHVEDRYKLDPFQPGGTRVFQPLHLSRRIVAQDGWFTVHNYLKSGNGFVPLEKNRRYARRLMSLRVPSTAFPNLRFELDRCGVNASALFPDLEGLCRTIQWQHSIEPDETES